MGGGGGGGGGGASIDRIATKAAQAQISAKQSEFGKSLMGKVPSSISMIGKANLAAQQKALTEGGTAVAVPGTSFAPQGQAYTEAPGMKSTSRMASERFAVGSQGKPALQGPAGSVGIYSAVKSSKPGSSFGYVGDVAGVTKTSNILGMDVTTFTGKTGYSPTGQQVDTADKGGKGGAPTVTATEPEVTPEVTPEVVPDETVLASSTRRRTRFKRSGAGGTILEGFGALYS